MSADKMVVAQTRHEARSLIRQWFPYQSVAAVGLDELERVRGLSVQEIHVKGRGTAADLFERFQSIAPTLVASTDPKVVIHL